MVEAIPVRCLTDSRMCGTQLKNVQLKWGHSEKAEITERDQTYMREMATAYLYTVCIHVSNGCKESICNTIFSRSFGKQKSVHLRGCVFNSFNKCDVCVCRFPFYHCWDGTESVQSHLTQECTETCESIVLVSLVQYIEPVSREWKTKMKVLCCGLKPHVEEITTGKRVLWLNVLVT